MIRRLKENQGIARRHSFGARLHSPAQLEVFGFIDHTYPAAPELGQDAVMRNGFPDHAVKAGDSCGAEDRQSAGRSAADRRTGAL